MLLYFKTAFLDEIISIDVNQIYVGEITFSSLAKLS